MEKLNTIILIDDSNAANAINSAIIKEMNIADNIILMNKTSTALDYLKNDDKINYPIPELILLDIEMPDEDGFEFLKSYSDLDQAVTNSFSPIIVILSNHITPENFTKGKDFRLVGVECILRKPMEREDIEDVLEEHFGFEFD